MKKLWVPLFFSVLLLVGCSEDADQFSAEDYEELGQTDDIEKLIDTNERLVRQLEQYVNQTEDLNDEVDHLQEENDRLKNDILTYKTKAFEAETNKLEELALREEMDHLALSLFQAMHEKDYEQLSGLTSDQVESDEENNVLHVLSDKEVITSFHYEDSLLSQMDFLQQTSFNYDQENETCSVHYTIHSFVSSGSEQQQIIELGFEKEDDSWKVTSISERM
ncbi:hypothetical protein [Alteribacter aurantiacus]|uniref:hypothetical protein n=1 Tax=Alteribacter aurantiacus TaxID=254410 RepID=UPI0004231912|nr:hypothetical protein [Alteribacter aurantiacus]